MNKYRYVYMFIAFACTVVNDLVRFYLVRGWMSVRMKPKKSYMSFLFHYLIILQNLLFTNDDFFERCRLLSFKNIEGHERKCLRLFF